MNQAVVLFARTPEKGKVKTRLAKTYGDDTALKLHEAFLHDTLEACHEAGVRILLAHTNGASSAMDHVHIAYRQRGQSFGERFDAALKDARDHHPDGPLVILGADTPHLGPRRIKDIFNSLTEHDTVVGPAPRGGFYALGFQQHVLSVAEVFHHENEIPPIRKTIAREGLTLGTLPPFYDLDYPEDIQRLLRDHQNSVGPDWSPKRTLAVLTRVDLEKTGAEKKIMPLPHEPKTLQKRR